MKIFDYAPIILDQGFDKTIVDLKTAPIIGSNPDWRGFRLLVQSVGDSFFFLVLDKSEPAGFLELVQKIITMDGMPIVVYQTHVYFKPKYRRKGHALELFKYAARSFTLVPSPMHTAEANKLWEKLSNELPNLCMKRPRFKSTKYTIIAEMNRRQFSESPNFTVMLGTFVDWDKPKNENR